MKLIRYTIPVLMICMLAACAPSGSSSAGRASRSNMLTQEELANAGQADAYSAIQSLRPNWLRVRGTTSVQGSNEQVQVYLDGSRLGGVDQLRSITTSSINSIQYYDGLEASQRYGLGHGGGAIVVSTRTR